MRRLYSKNTLRLIKAALSTVLSDAVDDDYLSSNPALSAGRKRRRRGETVAPAEQMRPLSAGELRTLLATAAKDRRHHALLAVMAKAGLRPGEAMALQPGDLDLGRRRLHVERAVTKDGKAVRIKGTKTATGRDVDLSAELGQVLRRHLAWLRAEALRAGTGEPAWLFPRADGRLMDKDYVYAVFARTLKQAKLAGHRPYDLRHTFACLLLAEGVPLTYVAAQMGHANPTTTLRWYGRWIKGQGQRWVDVLDGRTTRRPDGPAASDGHS